MCWIEYNFPESWNAGILTLVMHSKICHWQVWPRIFLKFLEYFVSV